MALRNIVTLPEPVLKRKAHAVTKFDKNLQTLIDDMIETMRAAPGVGLAAPQIGLSERIIVIEYLENEEDEDKEDAPKKVWAVLNPEIIKTSEETLMGVEGCLSIPGFTEIVERPEKVVVRLNVQDRETPGATPHPLELVITDPTGSRMDIAWRDPHHAPLDAGGLAVPLAGADPGRALGLRRAGLGRLLGLGPG